MAIYYMANDIKTMNDKFTEITNIFKGDGADFKKEAQNYIDSGDLERTSTLKEMLELKCHDKMASYLTQDAIDYIIDSNNLFHGLSEYGIGENDLLESIMDYEAVEISPDGMTLADYAEEKGMSDDVIDALEAYDEAINSPYGYDDITDGDIYDFAEAGFATIGGDLELEGMDDPVRMLATDTLIENTEHNLEFYDIDLNKTLSQHAKEKDHMLKPEVKRSFDQKIVSAKWASKNDIERGNQMDNRYTDLIKNDFNIDKVKEMAKNHINVFEALDDIAYTDAHNVTLGDLARECQELGIDAEYVLADELEDIETFSELSDEVYTLAEEKGFADKDFNDALYEAMTYNDFMPEAIDEAGQILTNAVYGELSDQIQEAFYQENPEFTKADINLGYTNPIEETKDYILSQLETPEDILNSMEEYDAYDIDELVQSMALDNLDNMHKDDIADFLDNRCYSVPETIDELYFLDVSADDVRAAIMDTFEYNRDEILNGSIYVDPDNRWLAKGDNDYVANDSIDKAFKDAYKINELENLSCNLDSYTPFEIAVIETVKEDMYEQIEDAGIDRSANIEDIEKACNKEVKSLDEKIADAKEALAGNKEEVETPSQSMER